MEALAENTPRLPRGAAERYVVLTGNPNCGKTTLFNGLTGLRAKVGNYAGVTVERKEGRLIGSPKTQPIIILDLPGVYSLSPQSLDEQISRDALFQRLKDVPAPEMVVVVVDASNLQRNLYYASQVIDMGYPTVLALNMIDVAREHGHEIDAKALAAELGVPVFPLIANTGEGVAALRTYLLTAKPADFKLAKAFCAWPQPFDHEVATVAKGLQDEFPRARYNLRAEAILLLSDERFLTSSAGYYSARLQATVEAARKRMEAQGLDWRTLPIEQRYLALARIQEAVTKHHGAPGESLSDKLDGIFTHRIWGLLVFLALMILMFQSIFSFAQMPMDAIQAGIDWVDRLVGNSLAPGAFNDLLTKGVIQGVGAVIVFLPQICLLFLFIGLLEDTGYMARAAFLMDRLMSKVGLHGKSFIPMLSSFACAIPGIMATRTIESAKDRLVTILVAPLMSCSARLPVYTLLIAACIPEYRILGFLSLPAIVLLSMYLLGVIVALGMAWLFKKTLLKGPTPLLILELPPYKRPMLRVVLRQMWDRSKLFIRRAGTVILGLNIILWFLASYPKVDVSKAGPGPDSVQAESGDQLRQSFAGRLGQMIEPVIEPLGFDWKIGVGIVASFAAREVFVSTMALVYNAEAEETPEGTKTLAENLRGQRRADGTPVYTILTSLTLMVFYVFALQCVSTVAVVRRETNSWKWPLFQWAYMGALAWIFAFVTYRVGLWIIG